MTTRKWEGEVLENHLLSGTSGAYREIKVQRPSMKYSDSCRTWDAAVIDHYESLEVGNQGVVYVAQKTGGKGWDAILPEAAGPQLSAEEQRQNAIKRQVALQTVLTATAPWDVSGLAANWDEVVDLAEMALAWIEGVNSRDSTRGVLAD